MRTRFVALASAPLLIMCGLALLAEIILLTDPLQCFLPGGVPTSQGTHTFVAASR